MTNTPQGFRDRLWFCSNFYPHPIIIEGFRYPTSEHAYQAMKMRYPIDHDLVAASVTPGYAKKLARRLPMRRDWDMCKNAHMLTILREKFRDHEMARLLLTTGNEELVEHNTWGDTYWGVCNEVGENHLGKLLMQVRKELVEQQVLKGEQK